MDSTRPDSLMVLVGTFLQLLTSNNMALMFA